MHHRPNPILVRVKHARSGSDRRSHRGPSRTNSNHRLVQPRSGLLLRAAKGGTFHPPLCPSLQRCRGHTRLRACLHDAPADEGPDGGLLHRLRLESTGRPRSGARLTRHLCSHRCCCSAHLRNPQAPQTIVRLPLLATSAMVQGRRRLVAHPST